MKILLASEFCAIMTGLILGQAAVIWGRQLLGIYSSSPEVIEHGLVRLAYICGVYYLCGMMDTMVGILRGMGYAVIPMIMSLAGACGLRLIWLATVFQIERYHTVRTIYIAYPITWVVTFVGHLITFIIAYRKMMKKV